MHSINYNFPKPTCEVTLNGRDIYEVLKEIASICHEKLQDGPRVFLLDETPEPEIAEYYEGGFCRILDILGD
jgi:hypothetical protein